MREDERSDQKKGIVSRSIDRFHGGLGEDSIFLERHVLNLSMIPQGGRREFFPIKLLIAGRMVSHDIIACVKFRRSDAH